MTPSREQDPTAPEVAPERARDARRRACPLGRANRDAGCPSGPDHREAARPRPHLGPVRQPCSAGRRRHRPSAYEVWGTGRPHKFYRLATGASRAGVPGYARNHSSLRCALRPRLRDASRIPRVQEEYRLERSPGTARCRPNRKSTPTCSQCTGALAPETASFVAGGTRDFRVGVSRHAHCFWTVPWR